VAASADARVKGFADACYKDEKGVVLEGVVSEGILCRKDEEGK
jgi:hypothetical protein